MIRPITGFPVRRGATPDFLDETVAYLERVTADGGVVLDLNFVDRAYRNAIEYGYLESVGFWISGRGGVKLDGNGGVEKVYSLAGEDSDASQATAEARPNVASMGLALDGSTYLSFGPAGLIRNKSAVTLIARHAPTLLNSTRELFHIGIGSGGGSTWAGLNITSGQFSVGGRRLQADAFAAATAGAAVAGVTVTQIGCLNWTEAQATLHVDGELLSDIAFQTSGSSADVDSERLLVGTNGTTDTASFYAGAIYEALVVIAALDEATRMAVEERLAFEHPYAG